MTNKKIIAKEVSGFEKINEQHTDIEKKLDELITLLDQSTLDSQSIKVLQQRFNKAIEITDLKKDQIAEFKKMDALSETSSREEMLDEFAILLTNSRIDSEASSRFIYKERASAIVLTIISLLMIGLGFAMIIMPAPPYFEMFTIYYFNENDGITIMDCISLLIILAGIYLLITTFYRKQRVS